VFCGCESLGYSGVGRQQVKAVIGTGGAFGITMLLFLILEPRGLAGIWLRVRSYFQLWPFKYRAWET